MDESSVFPSFSRAIRRTVTLSSVAAASRHVCATGCCIEVIDRMPGAEVVEVLDLADVSRPLAEHSRLNALTSAELARKR